MGWCEAGYVLRPAPLPDDCQLCGHDSCRCDLQSLQPMGVRDVDCDLLPGVVLTRLPEGSFLVSVSPTVLAASDFRSGCEEHEEPETLPLAWCADGRLH